MDIASGSDAPTPDGVAAFVSDVAAPRRSAPILWPPAETPDTRRYAGVPYSALSIPEPAARPARRGRLRERVALGGLVVVAVASLGLLSAHDAGVASKWRSLDQAQAAQTSAENRQVQAADASIAALNAQVKNLGAQVATTQAELSSTANQKEKAIDQTTVMDRLLAAAGQVADAMEQCITSTDALNSEIADAAARNAVPPSSLVASSGAVEQVCQQAQSGNQALQAAIQSAS